jgi:hypothetical protein
MVAVASGRVGSEAEGGRPGKRSRNRRTGVGGRLSEGESTDVSRSKKEAEPDRAGRGDKGMKRNSGPDTFQGMSLIDNNLFIEQGAYQLLIYAVLQTML